MASRRQPLWAVLLLLAGVLAGTLCYFLAFPEPYSENDNRATLQAQAIESAINGYHREYGQHPESIDELAPYLSQGDAALVDPWEKRFQLTTSPEGRHIVWTKNRNGKMIKWPRRE